MILKNKTKLSNNVSLVESFGDYDIVKTKDDIPNVHIIGIQDINLSFMNRTPVAISCRNGNELLKDEFYNSNYNLVKGKVYFIVHILAERDTESSPTYVFSKYSDAINFQFNILAFKSNGFFGTLLKKDKL